MTDTLKKLSADTAELISYDKGAKLVKNYADQNDDAIVSHFIGREVVEKMLNQPGVVGISIYQGIKEDGTSTSILVGTDAEGDHVVNYTTVGDTGEMIKQKGIVAGSSVSTGESQGPAWW